MFNKKYAEVEAFYAPAPLPSTVDANGMQLEMPYGSGKLTIKTLKDFGTSIDVTISPDEPGNTVSFTIRGDRAKQIAEFFSLLDKHIAQGGKR